MSRCFRISRSPLLSRFARNYVQQSHRSITPAFSFDIDGVLLQGDQTLDEGRAALRLLRKLNIPFIFLTNGGGSHERDRAVKLSEQLQIQLDTDQIIQSHTPFQRYAKQYQNQPVLILGGPETEACKEIARNYGFEHVYNAHDVLRWRQSFWPFTLHPPQPTTNLNLETTQFKAIFVFNDSRDWGRDIQVLVDVARSTDGSITHPRSHHDHAIWSRDHQIPLHWSNPDIIWRAEYPQPRMAQGSFRKAAESVYHAITGQDLIGHTHGKPTRSTFDFAEHRLQNLAQSQKRTISTIYHIGDNPSSDVQGATNASDAWKSILVNTGIYNPADGPPGVKPDLQAEHALQAVQLALASS